MVGDHYISRHHKEKLDDQRMSTI